MSLSLKFALLIVSAAICASISLSQPGWNFQNPLPVAGDLLGVSFGDSSNGTAVEYGGTIVHTTDGGLHWVRQVSGTQNDLYGVSTVDATNGTVVGANRTILHTTNGGTAWTLQSSGTGIALFGVWFVDANVGTVVGDSGTILRTTNGGASWVPQSSGSSASLAAVHFVDKNVGTVVGGGGTILRTTDGGQNWVAQSSGITIPLSGVSFGTPDSGIAVGTYKGFFSFRGVILHTTDGGTTWLSQTNGIRLNAVSFENATHASAVGYPGYITQTTDGGTTWSTQDSGGTSELYGASFSDSHNGTAVGSGCSILRTTNGGSTWEIQLISVTSQQMNGVFFLDAKFGTAVGNNGTILHTTNGGSTWTIQDSGVVGYNLYGVSFANPDTGIAVGDHMILSTTNGGISWTFQNAPPGMLLPRGVTFTDPTTASVVGTGGATGLSRTTDFGNTWSQQLTGSINAVSFVDNNIGTAVSFNYIYRTTDGGSTWTSQRYSSAETYYGVSFVDANTGTVVGSEGAGAGVILHTTDGGITWTSQADNLPDHPLWRYLYGVSFSDPETGTVVGVGDYRYAPNPTVLIQYGLVYNTTNGGSTWTAQAEFPFAPLNAVMLTDANTGSAVGNGGVILRIANDTAGVTRKPDVVLNTRSFAFGNVLPGKSKDAIMIVRNSGNDTLHIASVSSSVPEFTVRLSSLTVPPGTRSRDTLRFSPDAEAGFSGKIVMYSNAPSSPDTIAVSGNGFKGAIAGLSARLVDCGTIMEGGSKDTTVTLTNAGNDTLTIVNITSSRPAFSARPTTFTIAPGQTATDSLRFFPSVAGADSGWIVLHSNSITSPDTLKIRGLATPLTDVRSDGTIPRQFALGQNYPNPFNPSTTISFDLPVRSHVTLRLFDILGKEVLLLASGEYPAGSYSMRWNAANVSSGIYFYRLEAGTYSNTKKLLYLK